MDIDGMLIEGLGEMPPTRFQGSKRRMAGWIADQVALLPFESVLDAFGGTGSVGFEFKRRGKAVTYNDALRFNYWIGLGLIENQADRLTQTDVDQLLRRHQGRPYDDVIARNFSGIYFTDDENRWIDTTVQNIHALNGAYRQGLAYFALFQAALAKRPYNLFHRSNLYMRHADVARSFGNKATWDRPFETHFRSRADDANRAVFDNGRPCAATCGDATDVPGSFDLVYIDPPYVNRRGVGVDYLGFYHFLEGLVHYDRWNAMIDRSSKHRRLKRRSGDPWTRGTTVAAAFERVFERFCDSTLVVSYRSDGRPDVDALTDLLRRFKPSVCIEEYPRGPYALSTNRSSREILLIGT